MSPSLRKESWAVNEVADPVKNPEKIQNILE